MRNKQKRKKNKINTKQTNKHKTNSKQPTHKRNKRLTPPPSASTPKHPLQALLPSFPLDSQAHTQLSCFSLKASLKYSKQSPFLSGRLNLLWLRLIHQTGHGIRFITLIHLVYPQCNKINRVFLVGVRCGHSPQTLHYDINASLSDLIIITVAVVVVDVIIFSLPLSLS